MAVCIGCLFFALLGVVFRVRQEVPDVGVLSRSDEEKFNMSMPLACGLVCRRSCRWLAGAGVGIMVSCHKGFPCGAFAATLASHQQPCKTTYMKLYRQRPSAYASIPLHACIYTYTYMFTHLLIHSGPKRSLSYSTKILGPPILNPHPPMVQIIQPRGGSTFWIRPAVWV